MVLDCDTYFEVGCNLGANMTQDDWERGVKEQYTHPDSAVDSSLTRVLAR
jgi:hypothetical protein